MAQVTIRRLEDDVKGRLERRADHNKRSLEAEIRAILSKTVAEEAIVEPAGAEKPKTLRQLLDETFGESGLTKGEHDALLAASAELRSRPMRTAK